MDITNILKLNVFSRAKVFIEELKEFAPFGAKYNQDSVIDVIYDSFEKDYVNSQNAIDILTNSFSNDIKNGNVEAAAVAFDVSANFKNSDGISEKRDALCLKITIDGKVWSEEYFPYIVINGECFWK